MEEKTLNERDIVSNTTKPNTGCLGTAGNLQADLPNESSPTLSVVDSGSALYPALLSCIGDLVAHVRRDGVVESLHCPDDHEFPLSADGVVGKRVADLLPAEIGLQATHYLEKTLRTGESQRFHCQYDLSGRTRQFEVRIAPIGQDKVLAVVRDVTDRRYFEKEILDVNHRTQLRIGQDLHDGLGQHLTGITFLSKALENKLSARGLPEAAEAAEIARLVIQALAQTRQLARSLFPVELESGGLESALKELAASMSELFKQSFVVESDPDFSVEDPNVTNHMFRLAQEAVNNAVKHGHAQRVVIRLSRVGEAIKLTIADDGAGFDPEAAPTKGLGMRIMQYRAKKIGAHLEFGEAAEGGTRVDCTWSPKSSGESDNRIEIN